MRIVTAALLLGVLAAPALAQTYPVQGRWGQSTNSETGHTSYILRKVDPDHIELVMEGGALKLQRCKG